MECPVLAVSLLCTSLIDDTWFYDSEWRLVTKTANHVIRGLQRGQGWILSSIMWPIIQLHLHNETPLKTLYTIAKISFLVGKYINVPGRWYTLIPRGEKAPHLEYSQTSPYVSLHLAGPNLYPLESNDHCTCTTFLNPVSHFTKSSNKIWGDHGILLDLQPVCEKSK